MGSKRKQRQREGSKPHKRPRRTGHEDSIPITLKPVQHPTLSLYYPHISSLRQHLLSRLQASASKARIRRLCDVGNNQAEPIVGRKNKVNAKDENHDEDEILGSLLNRTLVCYETASNKVPEEAFEKDFAAFSQQLPLASGSSIDEGTASQTEVSTDLIIHPFRFKIFVLFVFLFSLTVMSCSLTRTLRCKASGLTYG